MKNNDDPAFLELLKQIGISKATENILTPEVIAQATKEIDNEMELFSRECSWAQGQAINSARDALVR
jgi:hypothetical protein